MPQDPYQLRRVTPSQPEVVAPPTVDNPFQLQLVDQASIVPDEPPSVLARTLDVLATPGRMTMGAMRGLQTGEGLGRALDNLPGGTREDDFDDVLAGAGVEDSTMRRVGGFVGDMVLDPLNLVPIAPIAKGIGAATGLSKLAGKATSALREMPMVEAVGKRFVPHYGLDKFTTKIDTPMGPESHSFQDLARLHDSKLSAARERAGLEALDMFQGLTNEESKTIAIALDTGNTLADPRLETMRRNAIQRFEQQWTKESAAGMLPEGSKIEHYMPHVLIKDPTARAMFARKLTAKNPYQLRKQMTLEEGIDKKLFEPDVRRGMATRLATGDKALANQEFFQQTAKQFGTKVTDPADMPDMHRLVQLSADAPLKAALEGVALPNEIADALEKMMRIPEAPDTLSRVVTGFTALWKGYATRANPGFHVRNGVSNLLQTWMGGLGDSKLGVINPLVLLSKHAQAAKMVANRANLPGRIGKYTATDINKALDDYGIIGGAHTSFNEIDDLIQSEVDHAGKGFVGRHLNPFDKNNAILRRGAKAGNIVENTSRMALFIDQLEKGHSLEDAALHVRKYLFDYSELTDFEKNVMRNALPFYTWLRKNIPLQIDNVLTQPHKVAVFGKGQDALEDIHEDAGTKVTDVPDSMKDAIQLPWANESGHPVFSNPSLPIQDLNKLPSFSSITNTRGMDATKDVLASLTPWARIPLELANNEVYFTGRPLQNEALPGGGLVPANPLAQLLHKATGDMAGIVNTTKGVQMPAQTDYAMRQFPPVTTVGRMANALSDDPGAVPDNLPGGIDPNLLSLLGLPTRSLTPEQQAVVAKVKRNALKAGVAAKNKENRRRMGDPQDE